MDRGTPDAENGAGGNKSVVWDGNEGVEVESRLGAALEGVGPIVDTVVDRDVSAAAAAAGLA